MGAAWTKEAEERRRADASVRRRVGNMFVVVGGGVEGEESKHEKTGWRRREEGEKEREAGGGGRLQPVCFYTHFPIPFQFDLTVHCLPEKHADTTSSRPRVLRCEPLYHLLGPYPANASQIEIWGTDHSQMNSTVGFGHGRVRRSWSSRQRCVC